ncbi:MAG: hypothetical protein JSR99_13645 [Proteobacteria bacterium]|nr:hypothetical protein [Pseudomonadota bacterium]
MSNTIDYCSGNAWLSLGPSATAVPSFFAVANGTTSVPNNTPVKLDNLGSVKFDTNSNYANNRFTVTVPGTYIFTAGIRFAASTNSGWAFIYKNGSLLNFNSTVGGGVYSVNDTVIDRAVVGDYYEVYVEQATGSTMTLSAGQGTYFGGSLLTMNGGGGGTANPAGSTNDVQFNSGSLLAADSGNFTYASSTLTAPSILTGGITATGRASLTTVSSTLVQLISNTTTACTSGLAGAQRYNGVSNTIDYCTGTSWMSMGPSSTQPVSFNVDLNGTDQTVTTNAWTMLSWNRKNFDTNTNFTLGNGRFTATIPGKYLFTFQSSCKDGTACFSGLYKNGVIQTQTQQVASNNGGVPATAILDLGVNDYVQAAVYNGGGTKVNGVASYSNFAGVLLSPQGSGSGGGAPAGSTNDVQYNSSGALAADIQHYRLLLRQRVAFARALRDAGSGLQRQFEWR